MRSLIERLSEQLGSGPNRIALSTAARGTLATTVPLALFPHTVLADLTYPAVLGALATCMIDVGGPYRTRLVAMLVQALGGPCLLLLGSTVGGHWWAAAAVMAGIGLVFGLLRALGPGGASLGINTAVAFLVGVQVVGIEGRHATPWALGYSVGGVWTIVITLAFWHFRPYKRLEQEVAAAWDAVASLLLAAVGPADKSVVSRRRREQRIATAHAATRSAVEQARDMLGEMRTGTVGPGTTVANLVVLIDAAAGVAGTAVSLCELAVSSRADRRDAEAELAGACRVVGRILIESKGELPLASLREVLEAMRSDGAAPPDRLEAWNRALRHLEDAAEALRILFGVKHRVPDLLRLPFAHQLPRGAIVNALRTHTTPRSAVFRHAMRVAAVTACDTALLAYFRLPHGIWLPLTSISILQPDYSGTAARALQRTLGTVAGAVIAGALLATVRGTAGYNAAIGLLLFTTFLLIRRNYGYGITFLTPVIILLIGMSSVHPWVDLAQRVGYTTVGALLALAAVYLLWPQWERDQLRDRLARAIDADKAYVDAVLQGLSDPSVHEEKLADLRRDAEIAVANADAGFQRMLAEPERRTPLLAVGFALLVHLHRLCRHSISLSMHLSNASVPHEPLARLRQLIQGILEDLRKVISEGRVPVPWPSIEPQLAEVVAQLVSGSTNKCSDAVGTLLGHVVNDMTGLLSAAGYDRKGAALWGRPLASTL